MDGDEGEGQRKARGLSCRRMGEGYRIKRDGKAWSTPYKFNYQLVETHLLRGTYLYCAVSAWGYSSVTVWG